MAFMIPSEGGLAMKKYLSCACILVAAAMWGCIGLFSRPLLAAGFSTGNVVVIRNFGGMAVLLLWFLLRDRSVIPIRPRHLPIFFGTGVCCILFFALCYFRCQQLCSLAVSAILLYMAPAIVVLLGALVLHERITRKKLLALALALLGCSFVTGIWSGGLTVTAEGILFGLGSALFYALYSIISPFGLRHYGPFTVVVWTFIFSGLGSLFFLDWPGMAAGFSAQPRLLLCALGLMVVATALPFLFYTKGLSGVESGRAAILASVEPVVAAFIGILLFHEPMTAGVLPGLACILACVYLLR